MSLNMTDSPFDSSGVQVAWDSTSLGWFKTCPTLYHYQMVLGYTPRDDRLHLDFGIWLHTAIEHYYLHVLQSNVGHNEAIRLVVREALTSTWIDGKPWTHDIEKYANTKNRETLIRTIIWYLDTYPHFADDAKTVILANGKPAVELSFRFPVDHGLMLSGHMDRLVTFAGDVYVMDHKTTSTTLGPYYFRSYTPDNQVSVYSTAAKIAYNVPISGVIIDGIQTLVGGTNFERGFASRKASILEEWLEDFYIFAAQARHFTEIGRFPQNDKACFNCKFREVCSSDPRMREKVLASNFTHRPWNPLTPR
jgi:hypothetical protein